MIKFVLGVVLGFALATVGVSGIAKVIDNGVKHIQTSINGVDTKELDSVVQKTKEAVSGTTK
jgi:hypothetical protein